MEMERMQFVVNLLERAKIKQKYIDTLSTPASATYFDTAFTDPSYDESNNYLFLRSLGTLDLHRILVWHIFKKHPQVTQKTLTLVKINLLRDSKIGEFIATLGINAHILCDEKIAKPKKMSQNVFEAIVGAIAFIINHHKDYKFGIGNVVVSKLCTYVLDQLDQLDINVDKTSLDAKTTLKELYFDVNRMMRRLFRKDERKEDGTFHVELYDVGYGSGSGSGSEKLGEGEGATLIEAEQNASSDALLRLQKKGLIREKAESKKKHVGKVNIHYGKQEDHFHAFILNLLHQRVPLVSDLKLDKTDMAHFVKAFTSPDVNDVSNYELYETLGDNLLNNCVLWYISNRFPYLNRPDAVDLLTKIKIRIIQTKWIGELSSSLGFYDYIYCVKDLDAIDKLKVMEDVFESFFAALNMVVDGKYKRGMGFIVCYRFIASLLDEKDIPISYEVLVDPKTRLKELFDLHKTIRITYKTRRFDADAGNAYVYVSHILESKFVRQTPTGEDMFSAPRQILAGKKGYTEQEAEQNVASDAIQYYKNMGITKAIPKEYLKFCM
jgi:dsRNA-specific ribonuclease